MSQIENANFSCNRFNRFQLYKEHLERLILVKGKLDNNYPFYPKFFSVKASKCHSEKEKQHQILSDNNVLLSKMYDIGAKPSPYSKSVSHPKYCPVFDKTTFNWYARNKKQKVEDINTLLYSKYKKVKTTYPFDKYEKHYDYQKYLGSEIIRNHKNPCLSFVTFKDFKKRLRKKMYNSNFSHNSSSTGSKLLIGSTPSRPKTTNKIFFKNKATSRKNSPLKLYSSPSCLSNSTGFNSLSS